MSELFVVVVVKVGLQIFVSELSGHRILALSTMHFLRNCLLKKKKYSWIVTAK